MDQRELAQLCADHRSYAGPVLDAVHALRALRISNGRGRQGDHPVAGEGLLTVGQRGSV